MDVAAAHARIGAVDLLGWDGLPRGCAPHELFGDLSDDTSAWAQRPLGEEFERAAFAVLDLPGYYRPTVSVREGAVVLFDGMNPKLRGGFARLASDLGAPPVRRGYSHGTLAIADGEWIYATRGLTLFVNTTAETALHVALYAPTTTEAYVSDLRPHLGKTLRPKRTV